MIHDTLENFPRYFALHPRFAKVWEFLRNPGLASLPEGRVDILPDGEIFANVQTPSSRSAREAPLEFHRKYIDVQVPLSRVEEMGWLPLAQAPATLVYDAGKDLAIGPGGHTSRVAVHPGEFTIFFPQDVHAPCIGDGGPVKKIIVKVLAE